MNGAWVTWNPRLGSLGLSFACLLLVPSVRSDPGYDPSAEIARIQAENDARGYHWTAGPTSMNRIAPSERHRYARFIPYGEEGLHDTAPAPPTTVAIQQTGARTLPAVWDWRTQGGVTPAKSQGACASCWAFAAVGALEAAVRIHTGRTEDLSEQQILSCNARGYGCSGGSVGEAFEVLRGRGAVSEACMPYVANDQIPCTQYECFYVDYLDDYFSVPESIAILKEHVYQQPLTTTMIVYEDFLSYTGGCYEHEGEDGTNHSVLIVGWDDLACDGAGAWICKNSWGPGWGINGYFYIKYGICRIGSGALAIEYNGTRAVRILHEEIPDSIGVMDDSIEVDCQVLTRDCPVDEASATLYYGTGDAWHPLPMVADPTTPAGRFRGKIPPLMGPVIVSYWFSALDSVGAEGRHPVNAPEEVNQFALYPLLFHDDLEVNVGWTVGLPGDDATAGLWEWGDPEGTTYMSAHYVNPENDHTPDGFQCFCTGLAAGNWVWSNDVDGGRTSLMTPPIDMLGVARAELLYFRWYVNWSGGYPQDDIWSVDLSADNGSTWINIETDARSTPNWIEVRRQLEDYIPLTDSVRIRFVASDYGVVSVVEAAVDDITIVLQEWVQDAPEPNPQCTLRLTPAPNPFGTEMTVHFTLPAPVAGALDVYGIDGRLLRHLRAGQLPGGPQSIRWNGRDDQGNILPAGIYLVRLAAPLGVAQERILKIR